MYLRYTLLKMDHFDIFEKIGIGLNTSFIYNAEAILYSQVQNEEQFNLFVEKLKTEGKIKFKDVVRHGEVAEIIYCDANSKDGISYSPSTSDVLELSEVKHFDELKTIAKDQNVLSCVGFDIKKNMWQTIGYHGCTLQPSGWLRPPKSLQQALI